MCGCGATSYVDDLIIASKNPNELLDVLVNKYKLQLKGTEKLRYHLGADYFRDDDGTLCHDCLPRVSDPHQSCYVLAKFAVSPFDRNRTFLILLARYAV